MVGNYLVELGADTIDCANAVWVRHRHYIWCSADQWAVRFVQTFIDVGRRSIK